MPTLPNTNYIGVDIHIAIASGLWYGVSLRRRYVMKKLLCVPGLLAIIFLLHSPNNHLSPVEHQKEKTEQQAEMPSAAPINPAKTEFVNLVDDQNASSPIEPEVELGSATTSEAVEISDADDPV